MLIINNSRGFKPISCEKIATQYGTEISKEIIDMGRLTGREIIIKFLKIF